MALDVDDDYYYDTGTVNEELDNFQIYEKNGELHLHDKRTDDVVKVQANGNLKSPSHEVDSGKIKQFNNITQLNRYATGGSGTDADPWTGDWQSALDDARHMVFVPPGIYEVDSDLKLGPQSALWSPVAGGKDGLTRGAEFRATSNVSTLLQFKDGPNAEIDQMRVSGIHFNGQNNATTALDTANPGRLVWINHCWFRKFLGNVVNLDSRITVFGPLNEIEQNNDSSRGQGDFALVVDGGNVRSTWVYLNSITANEGEGAYLGKTKFNLDVFRNRILGPNSAGDFLTLDSGGNFPDGPIRITHNTIGGPDSDFSGPLVQTTGNGNFESPVWIKENWFYGDDTTDTVQASVAIKAQDDFNDGLFLVDNVAENFDFGPWNVANVSTANLELRGNRGDTRTNNDGTESGAVAIGSGDSTGDVTVTVAHGLDLTPPAQRIDAWLSEASAQDYVAYVKEIRNIGGTNFDVVVHIDSLSSTSGETVDLSWRASM